MSLERPIADRRSADGGDSKHVLKIPENRSAYCFTDEETEAQQQRSCHVQWRDKIKARPVCAGRAVAG